MFKDLKSYFAYDVIDDRRLKWDFAANTRIYRKAKKMLQAKNPKSVISVKSVGPCSAH